MFKPFTGWKNILALLAILIIAASLLYVNNLSARMQREERAKMKTWVEANKEILLAPPESNLNLASEIIANNATIPIIQVNKNGDIVSYNNLDPEKVAGNPDYLEKKLKAFKAQHEPLVQLYNPLDSTDRNYFYYGDSMMLTQIRYYPYIQLGVVALFILVTLIALSMTSRSVQNQLWVGLAKETAHQLGTPLSSIEAWLELLKEREENEPAIREMSKDMERLKLISERFSKIGSAPELEEHEVIGQVRQVVSYMKRRAPQKVSFTMNTHGEDDIPAMISPLLFDWVIENLLKNALDAMEGKGRISIDITTHATQTWIDVTDTGKGISKANMEKVFKPGFSTKRRGWGLGLSLSRRIIESYHNGRLFIKSSELNRGTTFRIMLRK